MYTNFPSEHHRNRTGFALIAVLFSLIILVLLFSGAQRNFLSHSTFLGSQYHRDNVGIVHQSVVAIGNLYAANPEQTLIIEIDGQNIFVVFQDVGGLVDLNAVSQGLLRLMLTGLGVENASEILDRYVSWRQQGNKLQRVSDFARVTGLPSEISTALKRFSTIHSGRRGINPEVAPIELLEILTGLTGSSDYLAGRLPTAIRTPPSLVNFHVSVRDASGALMAKLAVHIPAEQRNIRILAYGI